MYMPDVFKMI